MPSRSNERQLFWLLFGAIGGLCLAYFWPHEHVQASATDRDAKFAICTVEVGPGSPDAVFVLDFLTGRLQGGLLNPQAQAFTNFWFANVAQDFKVGKNGKYTMIPGSGFLNAPAGAGGGRSGDCDGRNLHRRSFDWNGRLLSVQLRQCPSAIATNAIAASRCFPIPRREVVPSALHRRRLRCSADVDCV